MSRLKIHIYIIVFGIFSLLFFLFSGCQPPPQGIIYEGMGVAVRLEETAEKAWKTYSMKAGQSFQGSFYMLNQQPLETFAFVCLIDYVQAPCLFEGEQATPYFIEMMENDEKLFSLETPPFEKGFHDMAILAFSKVDNHDTNKDFRFSTDLNYLYSSRAVILADTNPNQLPLVDYLTGELITSSPSPLNGVVINRSRDSYSEGIEAWFYAETQPGEMLEYSIHLGNDDGEFQTYAVMAFLDFEQIPINAENLTAFVSLPAANRITIPAVITAPKEIGIHELVIVIVYNPYQLLEDLSTHKGILPDDAESSIRVAIDVK